MSYPQLANPIDKTGMVPSCPCTSIFYRSGERAAVTAVFEFESEDSWLSWPSEEAWAICEIAAKRNVEKIIFVIPGLPIEGYIRVWDSAWEIKYEPFDEVNGPRIHDNRSIQEMFR